jgi:hypothetical protein
MKWLIVLPLLLSVNKCQPPYPAPSGEICVHNQDSSAECTDLRLPEGERSYSNENLTNYICSNPTDFQMYQDHIYELRSKLISCEKKKRWGR